MAPRTALLTLLAAAIAWGAAAQDASQRVALDLFVMSKCPDAVYCEDALTPAVEALKDAVDLRFHYIGTRQEDGSWGCKHGPGECAGNTQQLCLQSVTPVEQRVAWVFGFVKCNNRQGMDAIGQPIVAATCMKEVGFPFGKATQALACMYGPTRTALLEADFAQTEARGVATSCTIQVEGNTACVRDGGRWKDCPGGSRPNDFLDVLCAAYATKNRGAMPPPCKPALQAA